MSSTEQLRALRDAANESWTAAWVDRAIAAMEQQAVEQAQPSFPLPDVPNERPRCSCGYVGWPEPSCGRCGKQFNEQAQPPARKLIHGPEHGCAQPSVATDVPKLELLTPYAQIGLSSVPIAYFDDACDEARRQHATAVRIAAERDEWKERAEKAEAGLVALEGQEPVATLRYSAGWQVQWSASCQPFPGISLPVYARPVPADSSPREQHEAALAEARRDGLREALELVERDAKRMGSTWYDCRQVLTIAADGIRALMEVKP